MDNPFRNNDKPWMSKLRVYFSGCESANLFQQTSTNPNSVDTLI